MLDLKLKTLFNEDTPYQLSVLQSGNIRLIYTKGAWAKFEDIFDRFGNLLSARAI